MGATIPARYIKRPAVALAALLSLAACATAHIVVPYVPDRARLPDPALSAQDIGFNYVRRPLAMGSTPLDHLETDHHRLRHLRFPSVGDNGQPDRNVDIWYYASKHPGRKKLIIVLPIWGSYVYPSWTITQGLLGRYQGEANIAYVLGENYLLDWDGMATVTTPQQFDQAMRGAVERFRTMVIDIRRFIDWAASEPGVDETRIGLIGFSISAMVASLTAAAEPRVRATALVMGGAHPHAFMAVCDGRPEMVRGAILSRFGWRVERYQTELARVFGSVDVARFPGRVHPARVLMIDAEHDTCAPKSARDALWQAMGRPQRIRLLYDHKQAFLAMTPLGLNWLRGEIYRFFDRAL